jgi:hypothetical protein
VVADVRFFDHMKKASSFERNEPDNQRGTQ